MEERLGVLRKSLQPKTMLSQLLKQNPIVMAWSSYQNLNYLDVVGMGRRWISPPGGLWFSVIIKSDIKTSSSLFLSYAMSLAVCETITNNFNLEAIIKWPNDVLIKAKKVAGVLINSAVRGEDLEYCVIGVGINLNSRPEGLKGSTSLVEHTTSHRLP